MIILEDKHKEILKKQQGRCLFFGLNFRKNQVIKFSSWINSMIMSVAPRFCAINSLDREPVLFRKLSSDVKFVKICVHSVADFTENSPPKFCNAEASG